MDETPPRRFSSRSRQRLALGGLAAAAGLTISGCDSPPRQFATITECTSAGISSGLCAASYNNALIEHQRSAPRFATLPLCEAKWGYGRCAPMIAVTPAQGFNSSPWSSGSQVYGPALAGFVVPEDQRDDDDQHHYAGGHGHYYGGYGAFRGMPVYRSRSGDAMTIDHGSGHMSNLATHTTSRGGFGGSHFGRFGG